MKNMSRVLHYQDCFETLEEAKIEIQRLHESSQRIETGWSVRKFQLEEAISQWADAKAMRCLCCDEGNESSPCTCTEGVAALERAEKQLLELAPKNTLP